jgi:hypothetical protein
MITHDPYITRKGQKSKIHNRYNFFIQKEIPLNYFLCLCPLHQLKGDGVVDLLFFKSFCCTFKKVLLLLLLIPESHFYLPFPHSFFRERVIKK